MWQCSPSKHLSTLASPSSALHFIEKYDEDKVPTSGYFASKQADRALEMSSDSRGRGFILCGRGHNVGTLGLEAAREEALFGTFVRRPKQKRQGHVSKRRGNDLPLFQKY